MGSQIRIHAHQQRGVKRADEWPGGSLRRPGTGLEREVGDRCKPGEGGRKEPLWGSDRTLFGCYRPVTLASAQRYPYTSNMR